MKHQAAQEKLRGFAPQALIKGNDSLPNLLYLEYFFYSERSKSSNAYRVGRAVSGRL